jgi:hypothetical protein
MPAARMLFVIQIEEALTQRPQRILVVCKFDVPDFVSKRRWQCRIKRLRHDGISNRQNSQTGFVAVFTAGINSRRVCHWLPSFRVALKHLWQF